VFTPSELVATRQTGNVFIDAITYDRAWIPGIVINYVLEGNGAYGGTTWGNEAREGFAASVASWSAVANVRFVEEAGPYRGIGSTAAYATDLVIDLAKGTVTGDGDDTLVSIEGAIGGCGNDILIASDGVIDVDALNEIFVPDEYYLPSPLLVRHFASSVGDPTIATGPDHTSVRSHGHATQAEYTFKAPQSGPVIIDIDNSFAIDTVIRKS
jgi:hypothetical protein